MEQEIWKDYIGYEGLYQVSNLGRVKGLDRYVMHGVKNFKRKIKGRILRASVKGHGGMHVILHKGKQDFTAKIHNLVLTAFVGQRPYKYEACHFPDSSYSNNRLDNLRWDTKANNEADKRINGTDNRGERHGMAILKNEDAKKIKKLLLDGYEYKEISNMFNVNLNVIRNIHRGITWKWLTV